MKTPADIIRKTLQDKLESIQSDISYHNKALERLYGQEAELKEAINSLES